MPKVAIITVSFNAAATIENTILSVTGQSYPDVEFIIIDGGSTDGTTDVIKKYVDDIAYWSSEKDNGIYDAMNKGIAQVTAEYILFLGADDRLFTRDILTNVLTDENTGVDFLYGNVKLSSSGKIFGCAKDYRGLLLQNISHQAIFYRTALLRQKGNFNTRYKILADYYFNLQVFRDDSVTKKYIPATITLYNDKGISNTSIDRHFFNDMYAHLLSIERMNPRTPEIQQYFFYKGFCALHDKKYASGLNKIVHAIIFGKRKAFYFLVAVKFMLSFAGIGKKINFK